MYAYREYLTLAEAANVLSVDEQTLFQRAMYPLPNMNFPKIGFKASSDCFIFCKDSISGFVPEFPVNDDEDRIVKGVISDILYGYESDSVLTVEERTFLYLKPKALAFTLKHESKKIGWHNWDIEFSQSEIFYNGSIDVDIPPNRSYLPDAHYAQLASFFDRCSSVGYSSVSPGFLNLSDLMMYASDVYDCKEELEDKKRSNSSQYALPVLQEKEIADLTLKISDFERLFDPRMQRVLKPIAEAIHQFSDSNVYQKFQDKKASATLSQVKEWVKCNSCFKDDRAAEVVKNLINEYYTLKNI